MTLDDLPEVLKVEHVQDFLRISKSAAYALVKSGQFHVVKIGRKHLIPKSTFADWVEGQKPAAKVEKKEKPEIKEPPKGTKITILTQSMISIQWHCTCGHQDNRSSLNGNTIFGEDFFVGTCSGCGEKKGIRIPPFEVFEVPQEPRVPFRGNRQ